MPSRPSTSDYAAYYQGYVNQVPEADILPVLAAQPDELKRLLGSLPAERWSHRYAEGKWSIREVVGHCVDAERVFGYRLLAFSRGDTASLPSFDEGDYVAASGFERSSLTDLIEEFEATRRSNVLMMARLTEEDWTRSGIANNDRVTVASLAWIMAGHFRHHLRVVREKYLVD